MSAPALALATEEQARQQLMDLVKEGRLSISQAVEAQNRHSSAAVRLALEAAKRDGAARRASNPHAVLGAKGTSIDEGERQGGGGGNDDTVRHER